MLKNLSGIQGKETSTSLYSTVSGKCEKGTHLTADYWFQNARQPVYFTDALTEMVKDGFNTFIEIGPHPVLIGGAESLFKKLANTSIIFPSMTKKEPEVVVFLQSMARLAIRGIEPHAGKIFGNNAKSIPLQKYP